MMRRWMPLVLGTLLTAPAFAQDADGDGVPDAADAFPCDPDLASVLYAPSEGTWNMLAFEDEWPYWTDLDFNDVVIRSHYRFYNDAQGRVRRITALFDPVALGGDYSNGLAVQLPVSRAATTARRRVGGGEWQPLSLEPDADATLIVSENLRELFGGVEGTINSRSDRPIVAGSRIEVELVFSSPAMLDTGLAPFDVFIFRSGDFGHQIHFPAYGGTGSMNTSLFLRGADASAGGSYFTHVNGTPFAMNLQDTDRYPLETVSIDELFPNVVTFAASGGVLARDFYRTSIAANRGHAAPSASLPAEPQADISCTLNLYDFSSHTFTHCGQTGSTGPSLSQCRSAYSGAAWAQDSARFDVTSGIQLWTVPQTGTYRITASGAGLNAYSNQRGARMRGDFQLQQGQQLRILVGQVSTRNQAGSGGTFVATANNTPLLVAGGAGGSGGQNHTRMRGTTNQLAELTGSTSNTVVGGGGRCFGCNGRGGGGFHGDGLGSEGGQSFVNGGLSRPLSGTVCCGGFGGGGGASTSAQRSGGGGGYSGGNAGETSLNPTSASGGGSFNGGTQQSNQIGVHIGHGTVVIQRL